MKQSKGARFGIWLLKVLVSYTVFILLGLLISLIPAGNLGISEEMFYNLRMFFMLFGPVYLTLIVRIILIFIQTAQGKNSNTAETGRGAIFAVTALLLLANLSNTQTASDLAAGMVEGDGFKTLEHSKRYFLKGNHFG